MLVSTLSGGLGRHGNISSRFQVSESSVDSCPSFATGKLPPVCDELDVLVRPLHLLIPWISTLSIIVVLCMPTILLRSKGKEAGLRRFAAILLRFLALLASVSLASGTPLVVRYAFSIYACVRVLTCATRGGDSMWWGLRYTAVVGLLVWHFFHGPPISLMAWPESGLSDGSLYCAYLAHLLGCVGPGIVLLFVQCVIGLASFVDIRDL